MVVVATNVSGVGQERITIPTIACMHWKKGMQQISHSGLNISSVSEKIVSNGVPGIVESMVELDAATGSSRTVRSTANSSSVYIPGVCRCLRTMRKSEMWVV
jgi:hypothetical protein